MYSVVVFDDPDAVHPASATFEADCSLLFPEGFGPRMQVGDEFFLWHGSRYLDGRVIAIFLDAIRSVEGTSAG
jgi:hypothetical protein